MVFYIRRAERKKIAIFLCINGLILLFRPCGRGGYYFACKLWLRDGAAVFHRIRTAHSVPPLLLERLMIFFLLISYTPWIFMTTLLFPPNSNMCLFCLFAKSVDQIPGLPLFQFIPYQQFQLPKACFPEAQIVGARFLFIVQSNRRGLFYIAHCK